MERIPSDYENFIKYWERKTEDTLNSGNIPEWMNPLLTVTKTVTVIGDEDKHTPDEFFSYYKNLLSNFEEANGSEGKTTIVILPQIAYTNEDGVCIEEFDIALKGEVKKFAKTPIDLTNLNPGNEKDMDNLKRLFIMSLPYFDIDGLEEKIPLTLETIKIVEQGEVFFQNIYWLTEVSTSKTMQGFATSAQYWMKGLIDAKDIANAIKL